MRNLLAFILGLFVVAILFRVDFFFTCCTSFLASISCPTLAALCHRGYQLRPRVPGSRLPGEKVTVTLQIQNRSLLPIPWLRIHDSAPIQLKAPSFFQSVASLLPRESLTLHYGSIAANAGTTTWAR